MAQLALIPARGGSKGIPRKNIRQIGGKPLIVWTIEAALAAPGIDTVVVSTEDPEIADIARAAGAEIPFLRPLELAADDTPGIDPVLHAMAMLPHFDSVMLLQPTSPLRGTRDIEGVLALAVHLGPPSIVSVCKAAEHPGWMYRMKSDNRLERLSLFPEATRRQDLPPVFSLNGAIYYARADWLTAQRGFIGPGTLGYTMSDEDSIDIDGPLDWRMADMLLADRAV